MNIIPSGEFVYHLTYFVKIKFEIWRVTFFLNIFLPLENYGMDFRFSGNNENIKCALHLR